MRRFGLRSKVLNATNALNALHVPNPLDELDKTDKMSSLLLREDQQKDDNIRLVHQGMETHPREPSPRLTSEIRTYMKHFIRLEVVNGVLY